MKNILITGCAGYLGSKLTQKILSNSFCGRDYQLIGVDNLLWGKASINALSQLCSPHFDFHYRDITKIDGKLAKILLKADVVIHLAGYVGADLCKERNAQSWEVNYEATKNLVDFYLHTRNDSQPWFVFPDTNSSYGASKEPYLTEESPLNPLSDYGKQKMLAAKEVEKMKNHSIFRLATLFGLSPRMRLDLLPNDLVQKAYLMKDNQSHLEVYEGHFWRNFVHIDDVVSVLAYLTHSVIGQDEVGYARYLRGVFNLSDSRYDTTKLALIKKIFSLFSIDHSRIITSEKTDPDGRNCKMSTEKLLDALNRANAPDVFQTPMKDVLQSVYQYVSLFMGFPYLPAKNSPKECND